MEHNQPPFSYYYDDGKEEMNQLDADIAERNLDEIPSYDEDFEYVQSEYVEGEDEVDFTQIACSPNQSLVQNILCELMDIDISFEKREAYLQQLHELQPNLVIEYVQNLCSSYEENCSSVLREFIQDLIRTSNIVHFIVKVQAAESICDTKLLYELLNQLVSKNIHDVEIIVAASKLKAAYEANNQNCPEELFPLLTFVLQHTLIHDKDKVEICQQCRNVHPFIRQVKLNDPGKWQVFLLQTLLHTYQDLKVADLELAEQQVEHDENDISKGVLYDFYLSLQQEEYTDYREKAQKWFLECEAKTIYENTQNVHHVSTEMESFMDILMSVDMQNKTVQEWYELYKRQPGFAGELCSMALQRMSVDMSVYGKASLNLKQIFVRCMLYIGTRDVDEQELLQQRMKEELEDAAMTCSSGHLIRLMNVFSGLENFIKVDPFVELKACVAHRLQRAIEQLSENEQDEVQEALLNPSDPSMMNALYKTFSHIHDQLQREYVGQSLMTEQQFTEQYREAIIAFTSK